MKNIKILLLGILISLAGCEDFLDINDDPNSPTTPAIDQLLPSIVYDIADDFSLAYNRLGYVTSVYTHQLVSRENCDQYGVTGSYYAITTYWQDLYSGPVMDLKVLIDLAEDTDNKIYAGVAKILKAYTFHMMVDLWGDIPYFQTSDIENLHPEFDNDQVIYADLFLLIDDAIADLTDEESENIKVPAEDDLIYGGDVDSWIKLANTLKLKMYNQVRLTSMFNQDSVNALLANGGERLIGSGEDFMVPFGTSATPENRHPAFVAEYVGAQISNYISPWFFETLMGMRTDILVGISDPRIPYYWVNQLAGNDAENSPEYKEGDFNSIYFGSIGTNRDHAGRASYTMMGTYVCGGKFDDGTGGGPLGQTDATGSCPQRLITYADRLFIEAELLQASGADASDVLSDAIYASFELVDEVTAMVAPLEEPDDLSGSGSDTAYIDAVMAEYYAGTTAKQLEIIMTQKWIQSFGNGCDNYTDYRRTGYPVMFDPNSNDGVQSGGTDGSGPVPTQSSRDYPVSMPYDADELILNNNAPAQKVIAQSKVFWDVD